MKQSKSTAAPGAEREKTANASAAFLDIKMFWTEIGRLFSVKNILAPVPVLLLCAFAGVCLLCGVYLLPTEPMQAHMPASAAVFEEEGAYPLVERWWVTSYLDNTTDSIMLMEASDDSSLPTLQKALLIPRGKFASASEDPNGKDDGILDPVGRYVLGLPFSGVTTYPRYWHGYLLYIKPLLALTHYGTMRLLNALIQTALILLLFRRMAKRGRGELILPWLLMVLLLMPSSLARSFQFSSCFYIMLLSSHACLSCDRERLPGLFLYAGIATAYFDFLTYPVAAFGVPAVLALALMREETTEKKLAFLLRAGLHWCFGYGGMWALKWVIASLLTEENVLLDAWDNIRRRTSPELTGSIPAVSAPACMRLLTGSFFRSPAAHELTGSIPAVSAPACMRLVTGSFFRSPAAIPAVLYAAVKTGRAFKRGAIGARALGRRLIPYLLVGALPYLWYSLTVNHSYIHFYFTCRALCVSALALLVFLAELDSTQKN